MFKKTLLAAALAGCALASGAYAADVQLYGRVDLGLQYTHLDRDAAGTDSVDNFTQESGNTTGSRWGLKGAEDLGNGYKAAFVLENGFSADDGALGTSGSLFNRQSTLHLSGPFGEISFGRVAIMASDSGSYGIGEGFSSLGTGVGDILNMQDIFFVAF